MAVVTRPDGAKVIVTSAVPLGSASCRQDLARSAALSTARAASCASNGSSSSAGSPLAVCSSEVALAILVLGVAGSLRAMSCPTAGTRVGAACIDDSVGAGCSAGSARWAAGSAAGIVGVDLTGDSASAATGVARAAAFGEGDGARISNAKPTANAPPPKPTVSSSAVRFGCLGQT